MKRRANNPKRTKIINSDLILKLKLKKSKPYQKNKLLIQNQHGNTKKPIQITIRFYLVWLFSLIQYSPLKLQTCNII